MWEARNSDFSDAIAAILALGCGVIVRVASVGERDRSTDIRQIARTGWRPLVVAVIGLTVVATISLGIVLLTSRVLGWNAGT